jgi:hypothetical protein
MLTDRGLNSEPGLRRGANVRVGGRAGVFVKVWGTVGAVIRYDDRPQEPKVVPLARIEPA